MSVPKTRIGIVCSFLMDCVIFFSAIFLVVHFKNPAYLWLGLLLFFTGRYE